MPEKQHKGRFVGHSKQFSVTDALEDAVQQAAKAQGGVADGMIEFEVVGVRGRSGGIAGFRDVWVEISVGRGGKDEDDGGPTMTTLAVGEEGGDVAAEAPDESEQAGGYTTMAVGEEGGESIGDPPAGDALGLDPEGVKLEAASVAKGGTDKYTTLAIGEEGG